MRRFMHWLVARPGVYEFVQWVAGTNALDRRVAPLVETAIDNREEGLVVDVGGGTGRARRVWPATWEYVCIEPDPQKILPTTAGFDRIIGDATRLPVQDNSVDIVMMRLMAHHLDETAFGLALAEVERVLRLGGRLLFVEPIWCGRRWLSRLLWRYDVGRHPRSMEVLTSALASKLDIAQIDQFQTLHRFVFVLAQKRSASERLLSSSRSERSVSSA